MRLAFLQQRADLVQLQAERGRLSLRANSSAATAPNSSASTVSEPDDRQFLPERAADRASHWIPADTSPITWPLEPEHRRDTVGRGAAACRASTSVKARPVADHRIGFAHPLPDQRRVRVGEPDPGCGRSPRCSGPRWTARPGSASVCTTRSAGVVPRRTCLADLRHPGHRLARWPAPAAGTAGRVGRRSASRSRPNPRHIVTNRIATWLTRIRVDSLVLPLDRWASAALRRRIGPVCPMSRTSDREVVPPGAQGSQPPAQVLRLCG